MDAVRRRRQAGKRGGHGGVFVARGAVVAFAAGAVADDDARGASAELFFGPLVGHVLDSQGVVRRPFPVSVVPDIRKQRTQRSGSADIPRRMK